MKQTKTVNNEFCFMTVFFRHPLRVAVKKKREISLLRQGQLHGNHRSELLWVLWSLGHTARRHKSSSFSQCSYP
jgi:hypothetical protein